MSDLFQLRVVPDTAANRSFLCLRDDDIYATTRALMNRLYSELPRPDGNFVKDFQTTGFEARVWELYLFAIREDNIWSVGRPCEAPDYLFSRFGEKAWVEAVIAGPTQKLRDPVNGEDIQEFVHNGLAIRFGTPLGNKLAKRYWELPHVTGRPLIIAVADFAQSDLMPWTGEGLRRYLYGHDIIMTSQLGEPLAGRTIQTQAHRYGAKTIPSGFFSFPNAEQISAVLFSNAGTVDKFHRKAFDPAVPRSYRLLRHGLCPDPRPESPVPQPFVDIVGLVDEPWHEGLVAFHNPNALLPLSRSFFYGIMQWWFRDGEFQIESPEFYPFNSVTFACEPAFGESDDAFLKRVDGLAEYLLDKTQITQEDIERTYASHLKRAQQ